MKKALIGLLVAGTLFSAPLASAEKSKCDMLEELARVIMTKRQNGVSLKRMMNTTDIKAFQVFILKAYDVPNYSSREYEQEAIDQFANEVYGACIKNEMK